MNNEKNTVILHVILLKVELFCFSIYKRKTVQIDKTYVQFEAKLPIFQVNLLFIFVLFIYLLSYII